MRNLQANTLHNSTREKIVITVVTGFCVLLALCGYAFGLDHLTIPMACLCLIPPAAAGINAARKEGILAPFAVFSIAFSAYNGLLLVRFCFLHETDFPYPMTVDRGTLLHAAVLSCVGTLGLVFGWLIFAGDKRKRSRYRVPGHGTPEFITGLLFYTVALGLYLVQYAQLGGYMNAMGTDRAEKFEMMRETVSTPYVPFALVGLALSFYGSVGKSAWRVRVCILMLGAWSLLVGLQGDRRLILQAMLAVFLVIGTLRPAVTKFRPVVLVVVALGIFAAMIFGQYRSVIADLVSHGMSVGDLRDLAARQDSVKWIMPESTEFGGPYLSVLEVAQHREDLLWGTSYLNSFSAIIPQKIYPAKKATPISEELAASVHVGLGPTYGWGYSPISEAYVNLGTPGVFVIMAIWAGLFLWLGSVRYRGLAGLLLCAVLLQEAVNANRIDFRYLFQESFFNIAAASAGLLCVTTFRAFLFLTQSARVRQYRLLRAD